MILPDNPIGTKEADLLRRWPLAVKVAELVRNYQSNESIVIGVEGPWGAGKTSFINLVVGELEKANSAIIVPFNPWNFSGQNELLTDFFSSLSSAVKKETGTNIFKSLKPYVSKLKMSISPSISIFGFEVNLGEIWNNGEKSLQEIRYKVDDELKKLPKKIVIVLDDLDRLDKEETRLIMKLVKMTANFSNTVFLLAYDRDRVAERLTDSGWSGEEYLKKIIQISFTLPEPDRQGLNRILFHDLDESIRSVYGSVVIEGDDEKLWGEIRYAGFDDLFKSVRDVKRYIDSLRLNWSIVPRDDINQVDFITIEAIRVFAPKFYAAISGNKNLFTGKDASLLRHLGKSESHRKERYSELLELIPKDIRSIVDAMCQKLFPSLDLSRSIGGDWQQIWRNQHRVCTAESFGFYFQLSVPDGAVSESEMSHLFSLLEDREKFLKEISTFVEDGRIRQVLSKILDRIETVSEAQSKALLTSLWESMAENDRKEVFDYDDASTQTFRIGFRVFKHVIQKEHRKDTLVDLVSTSSKLYHPSRLLALFTEEIEKPENGEQPLFTADELIEPKKIIVNKIEQMARDGSLAEYKEFVALLYRWKEWAGEDVVKEYVAQLISTEKGVVQLLKGYTGNVLSTAGNYKSIDRKGVVDFIALEDLQAAVDRVDASKLTNGDKEAIELFRNPPRRGW